MPWPPRRSKKRTWHYQGKKKGGPCRHRELRSMPAFTTGQHTGMELDDLRSFAKRRGWRHRGAH